MPIDTNYQRALSLAKAGKLEEAQNLLLTMDSPEAEKLLEKVNKAIAARQGSTQIKNQAVPQAEKAKNAPKLSRDAEAVKDGIKAYEKEKQQEKAKNQGIGCLVLIALFVACGVFFQSIRPEEPRSSIETVCQWQEMTGGNRCTPDRILRDYRPMVDACYELWSTANSYNIVEWTNCLENKSVDLID